MERPISARPFDDESVKPSKDLAMKPSTLIVGGGRGIGGALARELGEAATIWTRSSGVDVAQREQVEPAFAELVDLHGVPWGLVHTVGDFVERPLLETSTEDFEALIASNLASVFHVVQVVVPAMVNAGRGGRVVLFAAAGAGRPKGMRRAPLYFAIKAAVVQMARALASEVASSGVTVNCISPGLIEHEHSHQESQRRMQARVPMGRLGSLKDVTALVRFLLSEESSYLTGEDLTVDGGLQL